MTGRERSEDTAHDAAQNAEHEAVLRQAERAERVGGAAIGGAGVLITAAPTVAVVAVLAVLIGGCYVVMAGSG